MNKLPDNYENPVDVWILRFTSRCLSPLYATCHTPNMITTYSFVFGLLSIWCLYKNRPFAFAVAYALSYVFDCMDGQFARRYHMSTAFGDLYDHVTDLIVWLLLCVVVYRQKRHLLSPYILAVVFTAGAGLMLHMGCQQRLYAGSDTETLDVLRDSCRCDDWVQRTRFFGPGAFNLVIVCIVVYLYTCDVTQTTKRWVE